MWFIGVEVEQGTSAPPPKKDPGSAPAPNAALTLKIWGVRGGMGGNLIRIKKRYAMYERRKAL